MPYAAMLLVVLLWGSAAAVGRRLGTDLSALELSIWRVAIGFLLLLILHLLTSRKHPKSFSQPKGGMPFQTYLRIWTFGIFGYGIMIWLFFCAARSTLASHVVLILSMAPISTLLMDRLLGGRGSAKSFISAGISLLGIAIMVAPSLSGSGASLIGDFWALLAMLSFSLYTIGVKRYSNGMSTLQVNLHGMAAGLAFLWLVLAIGERKFLPAGFHEIDQWTQIAYLGLGSTGLAYFLYAWALGNLAVDKVVPFIYLQPVVGVLLSLLWLGEPFSLPLALGMGFIAAGLLWNQFQTNTIKNEVLNRG
ncbi:DMT family transporter [Cohnella herbarum]|uniref:EamA family transporter n=1 Tax=Cohnella herbarum TaxID=2728023 RepID=A0A7Z2ZLT9_9BACL|nr:EamA family transporter [Cohnella herbarum]QJD84636.1 EamA family transporter [Cohnella herbarum]